ncbi:LysR family transcriptional regulator [Lichenibacterium dinghuense]|uniref:LysR family transcriptional regulator n=1 Tax=Lichenibacterium dinghuense TaxID=2895977 RepID=UPI001F3BAC69|nr:LysR family transcriptional regulator [Lichenibacterium sp. 6Y81]
MTLDQLRVFVAVAEREHLTRGAEACHLTPSAATAAIQALEGRHGVRLFHRVGRRLELSEDGRAFLGEARTVLAAAEGAELALQELGGLKRGRLSLAASQTLASYWLPPLLMRFAAAHDGIALSLAEGNTAGVVAAVLAGEAEIGCVEGEVAEPALSVVPLADDRLVVAASPRHPLARRRDVPASALEAARWVMREPGSGTRAALEAALRERGVDLGKLRVVLTLPTNEAVCAAAIGSDALTAVSDLVVQPHVAAGRLCRIDHPLPTRRFALVRHKERFRTKVSVAFEALLREAARERARRSEASSYDI